jgi:protein-L-isoaspartate(D-aspartate) O-methyltransferase
VLVAVLVLAGICWLWLHRGQEPADARLLASEPVSTAPGGEAGATRPATSSVPATTSAPKWEAPTFKARQAERDRMVEVIGQYGLHDETVLKVMASVPRHEFVPDKYADRAYDDTPLPIGQGQTISQPYMVAEMTRLLGLTPRSRVLEIGTGSGYQAAVLAHLTPNVWSIEIVKPLAEEAQKRLTRLGYTVVKVRAGDGYYGWPGEPPFDAIIVTCAAGSIPPPLIRQLANGGRMVIPVGGPFATQTLTLVEKDSDGKVRSRSLMPVRFVPILGAGGQDQ